ncbi:MAG: TerB N-terminal domain-containing protein, partial [Oscillospiraceae bacterium]
MNKTKVANVISEALESDDNSQKQYKEQPILQTADKIKKYQLNEKYLEMRKIASSCVTDIYADNMAKIFYHQGKFMENYTDNYEFNGYFERYFPTYQAMNDHQLRGYFSWRTKIRKREKASCPSAFVFVYIYEIINQIGVKNPLDGFEKLNSIFLLYKNEVPNLSSYMNIWLKDYIVYYNLDCKLYTQPSE